MLTFTHSYAKEEFEQPALDEVEDDRVCKSMHYRENHKSTGYVIYTVRTV